MIIGHPEPEDEPMRMKQRIADALDLTLDPDERAQIAAFFDPTS